MKEEEFDEGSTNITTTPSGSVDASSVSLARYILGSDDPSKYVFDNRRLQMLFDKDTAMGVLSEKDIPWFDTKTKIITLAFEMGLVDYALEQYANYLHGLKITRSLEGAQLKIGTMGVQRTENIQRIQQIARKRTLSSKITGAFRSEEPNEEY